ncbi:MAG: GNAT family N-acetyltransferase [Porticoccaceae bacterium]|nr:GNAT family N-acetyltransferase [Porticoccaceae bacterium]
MLSMRIATIEQDTGCLAEHNCAMAYETEGKILDRDQVTKGVCGLFERPQFGFYLVAEDNGLVVASLMVTYEWSDWRNGLFWWIQSVYVNKTHRRKGIYRQMYKDLKLRAKSQKQPVCGFRLYAETENLNAHKTYESCGMRTCDYIMFEETIL